MKKIFLLALIFSLLTGGLFFAYLRTLGKTAEVANEPVLVAAADIPPRTALTAEMVKLIELPPGARHPAAARTVEEVIGLVTGDRVLAGEQVIPAKLKTPGNPEDGLVYAIEPGYRALTVLIAEDTVVAYHPKVGDYVDVISLVNDPKPAENSRNLTAAYLVAEDVKIIGIGRANSAAEDLPQSVTLMVKPAQVMAFALTTERVRLVLRGVGDHSSFDPKFAWNSSLLPDYAWGAVTLQ